MKDVKLSLDTGTFVRFWLVIIGFVAVISAVWIASSALITIAVAFFLTLVLNRPVSWIARHLPGKSRAFATLIAYLIILILIAAVFFNVVPIFVKQLASFLSTLPSMLSEIQSKSSWLNEFLAQYNLTDQYNTWLHDLQNQLGTVATNIGGSFVLVLNSLVGVIVNVLFVAVLTFLMLVEAPSWEEKFWRLVYRDRKKREYHQSVARKMYDVVSGYISGQITVAMIGASLTALAVIVLGLIFGFDISLAWSAWTVIFIMTFVPMFGALIGGGVVTLLLLLYSWPAAFIYLIYFTIEQQIENNVISPHIQSKKLNMSALIVLISIILGLQVGGLLGALVSIPVAGCIMVLVREYIKSRNEKAENDDESSNYSESVTITVFDEARDYIKPRLPKINRKKQTNKKNK